MLSNNRSPKGILPRLWLQVRNAPANLRAAESGRRLSSTVTSIESCPGLLTNQSCHACRDPQTTFKLALRPLLGAFVPLASGGDQLVPSFSGDLRLFLRKCQTVSIGLACPNYLE